MALISVKLITQTLWVDWYWVYATVYEFLALFAIAWDFWIYTVALREMASKLKNNALWKNIEKSKDVSHIYQNVLGLRIALMTLFMGIAIIAGFLIPKYHWTLIPYWIIVCSIAVFTNLVNSMATSILQLHLRMTYSTYSLIIWKIISVSIIAYWAFFTSPNSTSFFIFLLAWVIGHGVMLGLSLFYAKKFTDISPKFNFKYWKEIFSKAAPYWIALILWTIYFKIDVVLLSLLRNNEEVWIYAVGLRVIEVFTVLPIFFMNSVLPSLTKAIENAREKITPLLQFSFQFMAITSIPLVLWSLLINKFIIETVSSSDFVSWAKFELWWDFALSLLMIAMLFSFFSNFISVALVAFKKQKTVLLINAVWVTINIILNLIYIPKYWFPAAAITSIISEFMIFVTWFYLFQKTFCFFPKLIPLMKIIIASLIMFWTWLYLKSVFWEWSIQSLALIWICFAIYWWLIWKLDIINKKDLNLIK